MSFNIATQHIRTISSEITLVSQNVASADVENNEEIMVAKESVIIGSTPQGVRIKSYINNVDQILQKGIYTKISENAYNKELSEINEFINSLMGRPGENDDLSTDLVEMFSEMHKVAQNPANNGLKRIMVDKIVNYTNKISNLASQLEGKRLEIDNQIESSITSINQRLEECMSLKNQVFTSIDGSLEHMESDRRFRAALEGISEFLPIQPIISPSGEPQVFLTTGQTIVGNSLYFLKYEGASSIDQLVEDDELKALYLSSYDKVGQDTFQDSVIVTPGTTSERRTNLDKGKLAALVYIRDKKLPAVLNQLDLLAKKLKDAFNEIHNEGVGFPPASELKGTTLYERDDFVAMQGKLKLAIVDTSGLPVAGVDRLTIDFDKINTGAGTGKANLHGIINEINYHFGERNTNQNRVEIGNLKDIKLAAVSTTMEANEDFVLDFDLHNFSDTDAIFSVAGVTVTDNDGNPVTAAVGGSAITIDNEGNTRSGYNSGPTITISNGATISYPYTVDVTLAVNDGTTTTNAVVTYVIDSPILDEVNGLINKRFQPTATTAGTLINPTMTDAGIIASMTNGDNIIAPSDIESKGVLTLSTGNTNWGIIIDNATSNHGGLSYEQIIGTNNKFSFQFGLNDLFQRRDDVSKWGNTKNTAYYLKVRDDISGNHSNFAGSKPFEHVDYDDEGTAQHAYAISAGDFENGKFLFEIKNQQFYFPASGGLSARTQTLNSYAGDVVSHSSLESNVAQSKYDLSNSSLLIIKERFSSAKGVNVNDQMTKLMELMNASGAQNKIIGILQKFYESLFSVIGV